MPHHPGRRREPEARGAAEAPRHEARCRGSTAPEAVQRTRRPRRSRSPRRRRRRRRRRSLPDGPEDPSRRPSRRCHPRLEVELVHRQEGVRRLHHRGCPHPRAHHRQARACGPVRHPHPQGQAADHGRHLHRPAGDRDRQVGRRGGRAPQGAALDHRQVGAHQHQRDQAAGARRPARGAVDRRAAAEPRLVPPRHEAGARLGDALGRTGDQDPVRRPPRRRRDEPLRALHGGSRPAAHDPRRHRLRLRRGEDDLRPHRRQGLGQQGRDHARGVRGHLDRQGDPARRPGSGAPQARRRGGGPRRLARERPRARSGPRGPRPRQEGTPRRRPAAPAGPGGAAGRPCPAAARRPARRGPRPSQRLRGRRARPSRRTPDGRGDAGRDPRGDARRRRPR